MVSKTLNYVTFGLCQFAAALGEQIGCLSPMSTDHIELWVYYTVVIIEDVSFQMFIGVDFQEFLVIH